MNLSVSLDGTRSWQCFSARRWPGAGHMIGPLNCEGRRPEEPVTYCTLADIAFTRTCQSSSLPSFPSGVWRMMRGFGEWKHLALLTALVVVAIVEPRSFNWTESAHIYGLRRY